MTAMVDNELIQRFDSWESYIKFAKVHARYDSVKLGHSSWAGTENFAEAVTLARTGWREGAEKAEQMARRIEGAVAERAFHNEMTFVPTRPGALHMGRYVMGHPRPFLTSTEVEDTHAGYGKVIRVVVNMAASSGVSTDVITRRGAAIIALIDTLERAGRRCELDMVLAVASRPHGGRVIGDVAETWVTLKRAAEPLNIENVAFALAHPSSVRRIWFAAVESYSVKVAERFGFHGGFYGYPTSPASVWDRECAVDCTQSMYLHDSPWSTDERAVEWVLDQFRAAGFTVSDKE